MLDLKKWMTKVSEMFTDVVAYEKQVTASYSAGTIGTRGAQVSFDNPAPSSYYIRSILITYVSASGTFHPIAFFNEGKIYVNFYRASTEALNNGMVKLRITYTKKVWGGILQA